MSRVAVSALGVGRRVFRLLGDRPSWSAEREFACYHVDGALLTEARRRQEAFHREAYLSGLRIVHALGILDTTQLRGLRVLNLGAGECLLAAALGRCGAAVVYAVDVVPGQIWAAAERHGGEAGALRFVIAGADDLPFADGSFDLVVANRVLHHIAPLGPVLAEARRVLRPGGRLAAFEATPLGGALWPDSASENAAPLTPAALQAALRQAGFGGVRAQYYWEQLETSRLGALSPGFRVTAQRPGGYRSPMPVSVPLRPGRALRSMRLSGLLLDSGCAFAALAHAQEDELVRRLGR